MSRSPWFCRAVSWVQSEEPAQALKRSPVLGVTDNSNSRASLASQTAWSIVAAFAIAAPAPALATAVPEGDMSCTPRMPTDGGDGAADAMRVLAEAKRKLSEATKEGDGKVRMAARWCSARAALAAPERGQRAGREAGRA
jgi:hypothetical protein